MRLSILLTLLNLYVGWRTTGATSPPEVNCYFRYYPDVTLDFKSAQQECQGKGGDLPMPYNSDVQLALTTFQLENDLLDVSIGLKYKRAFWCYVDFFWVRTGQFVRFSRRSRRCNTFCRWGYTYTQNNYEPNYMSSGQTIAVNSVDKDKRVSFWKTRSPTTKKYPLVCEFQGQPPTEPPQTTPQPTPQPTAQPTANPAPLTTTCPDGYVKFPGLEHTCLKLFREIMTWEGARQRCLRDGATLLTIPIIQEDANKLRLLQGANNINGVTLWLGGIESLRKPYNMIQPPSERCLLWYVTARMLRTHWRTFVLLWSGTYSAQSLAASRPRCLYLRYNANGQTEINAACCRKSTFFVCQRDKGHSNMVVTEWFSYNNYVGRGSDRESFSTHRQRTENEPDAVTCIHPMACECRKKSDHGAVLSSRRAPTKAMTDQLHEPCILTKQDCRLSCSNCDDFEMRVFCPKKGINDCSVDSNKQRCEALNRDCKNTANDFQCVPKPLDPPSMNHDLCLTNDGQKMNVRTCHAYGDPHYTTFDERKYNFQGKCCYDFIKMCKEVQGLNDLSVVVCNDNEVPYSADHVSWTRSARIKYRGLEIFLGRDDWRVGSLLKPCHFQGNGISLFTTEKYYHSRKYTIVTIVAGDCLKIEWDNHWNLRVTLSEAYANSVCGLCGNMNGNPDDDLQGSTTYIQMAESFVAYDSTWIQSQGCKNTPPEPPCPETTKQKYKANKYCGLLNPDNNESPLTKVLCVKKMQEDKAWMKEKYEDCLLDHCENDKQTPEFIREQITCPFVVDVVSTLLKTGRGPISSTPIAWQTVTECGEDCSKDPNTVYYPLMSEFENTCKNPERARDSTKKFPGCACKDDYIRDGLTGMCIPVSDCDKHCFDIKTDPKDPDSGLLDLADGQEMTVESCVLKVVCSSGKPMYVPQTPCTKQAMCEDDRCICKPGYTGDGVNCELKVRPCRVGFKQVGRNCYKLIPSKVEWHTAALMCCNENCQLARTDSTEDYRDMKTFLDTVDNNGTSWVAGNTHIFGVDTAMYTLPSCYHKSTRVGTEDTRLGCFFTNRRGTQRLDQDCMKPRPFICYYANPIGEGSPQDDKEAPFLHLPEWTGKVTHSAAKTMCEAKGRNLPRLKNAADFAEIAQYVSPKLTDIWLDMEDPDGVDSWVWGDDSPVTKDKFFWSPAEPNNIGNERCGRLHMDNSGYKLRSTKCHVLWGYVVCGRKLSQMPHVWSPFVRIQGLGGNTEQAMRPVDIMDSMEMNFACHKPAAVDCQVLDTRKQEHVDASVNPNTQCSLDTIQCHNHKRYPCNNFWVRFYCPNEQDTCEVLKNAKGTNPCPGGQECVPKTNGCFDCQCPENYKLDHTGTCVESCGICELSGDPHFNSFTDVPFDFQGTCQYLFNGICPWAREKLPRNVLAYDILTRYMRCNLQSRRPMSCLQSFKIKFYNVKKNGKIIVIEKNRYDTIFWVNGMKHTCYLLRDDKGRELIRARFSSNVFTLRASGGLLVESVAHRLSVDPPAGLKDEMCGLCGQCGEQFLFGNGTRMPLEMNGRRVKYEVAWAFGSSWVSTDETDKGTDCEGKPTNPPPPEPTCDPEVKKMADEQCGIMNTDLFKACHEVLDPERFVSNCVFDACNEGTTDICGMIKVYADKCSKKKRPVAWREPAKCPMNCKASENKQYSSNVNCQKQCSNMDAEICSSRRHSDGCKCKQGFYELNGRCVDETGCGCMVEMDLNGFIETIAMEIGAEIFNCDCNKKIKCIGEGQTTETDYDMDPNAICVRSTPPTLQCRKGFRLKEDHETCERNPRECSSQQGFMQIGGRCVKIRKLCRVWRKAADTCNGINSTLLNVNDDEKFRELREIMKDKNIESVFVSGQVLVKPDRIISPILLESKRDQLEYANYHVSDFLLQHIKMPEGRSPDSLASEGELFAVGIFYNKDVDENTVRAVPRLDCLRYACEERTSPPGDYVPTGICSADTPESDGKEVERVSELIQDPGCLMCPFPTQIKCTMAAETNSTGTVVKDKQCKNKNGILYQCSGQDCADMEVSGKCPPDVNECRKGMHDCSTDQKCENLIGSYRCHCRRSRKLMIQGECRKSESCTMKRSQTIVDEAGLLLRSFEADDYGELDMDCQVRFAGVCKPLEDKTLSRFDILLDNKKTDNSSEQTVIVTISSERSTATFKFNKRLTSKGKFQFNGETRLGTSFRDLETGIIVTAEKDGTFLIAEKYKRFQILMRPCCDGCVKRLKLLVSDHYKNKLCGLCSADPAEEYDAAHHEVPNGDRTCTPVTPTPEPTTEPTTEPPQPTPKPNLPDSCKAKVKTNSSYEYKEVPFPEKVNMEEISSVKISVKACHSAYIILSKGNLRSVTRGRNMYEILIGGCGNTKSVIRNQMEGEEELARASHEGNPPLDCLTYRHFYVSWEDGVIKVGTQGSGTPFLTYTPNNSGFPVKRIFVAGSTDNDDEDTFVLKFKIDFPCTKPTEETCRKEFDTCSMLNDRCGFEVNDCYDKLCNQKMSLCDYLAGTTFHCRKPVHFAKDNPLLAQCQKACKNHEVMALWPQSEEMPSCVDKDASPNTDDSRIHWKLQCMCDKAAGYYYEDNKCVQESDCGCVMDNGNYRPLGDKWSAADCSKDYKCVKVDNEPKVVVKDRKCDVTATCVTSDDGFALCRCPHGSGVPDQPEGCRGDPGDKQTCYLKGTKHELCVCHAGYATTCLGCEDINECAVVAKPCKRKERCINEEGSYSCVCKDGFERNNVGRCLKPLQFTPWSDWDKCQAAGKKLTCGLGFRTRTRTVLPRQPRQPSPSELEEVEGCTVSCPEDKEEPDTTNPGGEPDKKCPDVGSCKTIAEVCGQVGVENPETYPSDCHLQAIACNRRQPSHTLYDGKCKLADLKAKRKCEDVLVKVQKMYLKAGQPECQAIVALGECQNRVCKGSKVNTCCEPDCSEMVRVRYHCGNGKFDDIMMESAKSCKCSRPPVE